MGVAIALAATAATIAGLVIWLGSWLRSEVKENRAASDMVRQKQTESDNYRAERDAFKVRLDGAEQELRIEKERRVIAEAQRNSAFTMAKKQTMNLIKESGIDDAANLVTQLIALDFRTGLLQVVPQSDDSAASDGLIDPVTMQPA